MLPGREFAGLEEGGPDGARGPRVLAEQLANLVTLDDKTLLGEQAGQRKFLPFLRAIGL